MSDEQKIRDAIETQVARRADLFRMLGEHDFGNPPPDELREECAFVERRLALLWADLRDARTRTGLYCLRCNCAVTRDHRSLHESHKQSLIVLPAGDEPRGLTTLEIVRTVRARRMAECRARRMAA